MRPRFGLDRLFDTPTIDKILSTTDGIGIVTQDDIMSIAYDTDFGLCNHATAGPWSPIELHPKENLSKIDPFRLAVDTFLSTGIHEKTGLNLQQYLSLERSQITSIKEAIIHFNKLVQNIRDEAKQEAEEKARGKK